MRNPSLNPTKADILPGKEGGERRSERWGKNAAFSQPEQKLLTTVTRRAKFEGPQEEAFPSLINRDPFMQGMVFRNRRPDSEWRENQNSKARRQIPLPEIEGERRGEA